MFDVLIIGCSLAGGTAALRLAEMGLSVAVFDKATFPRRKPCGEGLSNLACELLLETGIDTSKLPHLPFSGYRIAVNGDGINFALASKKNHEVRGIGIERYLLDNEVARQVSKHPGILSVFGERVSKVTRHSNVIELTAGDLPFRGRYLVVADGNNSVTANRLGIAHRTTGKARWGFSSVLTGRFDDKPTLVTVLPQKGFEWYLTPVANNRLNVSVLGEKGSLDALFSSEDPSGAFQLIASHAGFTVESFEKPLGVGPVGHKRRNSTFSNVLLVGDAAESLDPIGGMGMTHALISAKLASQTIHQAICNPKEAANIIASYETARAKAIKPFRGFTLLTHATMRRIHSPHILRTISKTPFPGLIRDALSSGNTTANQLIARGLLSFIGGLHL